MNFSTEGMPLRGDLEILLISSPSAPLVHYDKYAYVLRKKQPIRNI